MEAEPGRVRRLIARPRHFLEAFHLTDAHTERERQAGAGHVHDGEPGISGPKVTFQLNGTSVASNFWAVFNSAIILDFINKCGTSCW